ncbi:MAG: S41 family peptidase [Candidatus Zixiibacteriota bacterium]
MFKSRVAIFLGLLIVTMLGANSNADEGRLLRFPDVSKDKIAFVYAGDIYSVARDGGLAMRLTSDEGLELFPKFSPDGDKIAFTGQYDGDFSVYYMSLDGGLPVKLTFHPGIARTSERMGPENIVMGWHPDGQSILYRSRKAEPDVWQGRAYLVKTTGGLPKPLPMAWAGFTSFSPDAKKVAYCPKFRDFRTWKRYKGGMAQDVWIFDLESLEAQKITDWIGTDNMPMWYGDKIYYNSDRTGRLNLYCYDITTGETRTVTSFIDFDVRWPSLGSDAIAFENGGYIYLLELPAETIKKISIEMISDYNSIRPEFISVDNSINDFNISPDAKRAIFSARGDIFTVPAKEGNTRNLTNSSGAHDKEPIWSPDGKWIAYLSDETGEDELYLMSGDGKEKLRLTNYGHCFRYMGTWSPDSKMLTFEDKNNNLYYIDIDSKKIMLIDHDKNGIGGHNWSPDSRFIVYDKNLENNIRAIFVYAIDDGDSRQITPGYTEDYNPVFDPDGKYIYFLSQRSFNPLLGSYEFQYVNTAITNLYLILLHKDDKSPFLPESDEVSIAKNEDKDKDKKEDKKGQEEDNGKSDDDSPNIKIDFDGIYDRQIAFDLPAGNYMGLSAVSGAVFYVSNPLSGLQGNITDGERTLYKYAIDDRKNHNFAANIGGYVLDSKGKNMLLTRSGSYHIVSISGDKASFDDNQLNTSQMNMKLDRRAEYAQMFHEAWRRDRDFFYNENMHGVNWELMRERYGALVPFVAHRFDLTYLIGEMRGELCCSHTYTGGGDYYHPPSSRVALLGCDFEIDKKNERIKIVNILDGENWNGQLRSPLTETHVDINEGDYLLAIDGEEIWADTNPYKLTQNKANQKITLTVNDRPSLDDAREVVIEPLASESDLRYYNWVESNRAYVDSISDGKIGYIHLPDMGSYGLVRFNQMFYHQLRKEGLIIDVRWNGGGFVSQLVLDRLQERLSGVNTSRNGNPSPRPGTAVTAHMITLCNQFSCSDGDNFPYFFKFYKLGTVMGMRTWGGVVGISGSRSLSDGGYVFVPQFATYSIDSEWVMENEGVIPDIEIDNTPERLANGFDDQLSEAIKMLLKKIKDEPVVLPPHPGIPEKR